MQRIIKSFSELTAYEYHQLLELRIAVFVVEQNCPYQEVDAIDLTATHFWLSKDEEPVAYARIYETQGQWHIGRVVVSPDVRRQQLGTQLLQQVMDWLMQQGHVEVTISAQAHLQHFYNQFGFLTTSEEYSEDGIPHVEMKKSASSK